MKIETRDMVPESEPEIRYATHPGLVARTVIVVVLAVFLLFALRWAVGVTNANARQVSTGLSSLQERIDESTPTREPGSGNRARIAISDKRGGGPVLEPVEER